MAVWKAGRTDDLREKSLGAWIAVEHAVFAAFLIVEDELDGDAGLTRPRGVHRLASIANHVARVGGI